MPVCDVETGDIIGIINVFYVLSRDLDAERALVGEHMRPPLFISDSMPLDEILPRLRRYRQPMGIVRDAAREPSGIVTTEHVLQEIVGQIAHCRTETKEDAPTHDGAVD
jgi:CBS domain containing-hemolysin-like protein